MSPRRRPSSSKADPAAATTSDFTFVNTTGAPNLSQPAAKLMRGHVTKTNFAKRRQRLANSAEASSSSTSTTAHDSSAAASSSAVSVSGSERGSSSKQSTASPEAERSGTDDDGPRHATESDTSSPPSISGPSTGMPSGPSAAMPSGPPASMPPTGPSSSLPSTGLPGYEQILTKYLSLAYLEKRQTTQNPVETAWLHYLDAEPALLAIIDAALTIAHGEPTTGYTAEAYSQYVTNLLIQRIRAGVAQADSISPVVLMMTVSARLMGNESLWNTHINGLVAVIRERRQQNKTGLLPWLCDVLILDAVNFILGYPRIYHLKLIDALENTSPDLSEVARMADDLIKMRELIDLHRLNHKHTDQNRILHQIDDYSVRLHDQAEALRASPKPNVRVFALCIELMLRLLWPPLPLQSEATVTGLVEALKADSELIPFKPCGIYNDFTSCALMLGGVSGAREAPARRWCVATLKRCLAGIRLRGWGEPLKVFDGWLERDAMAMEELRALWREVAQGEVAIEDELAGMSVSLLAGSSSPT